MEANAAMRRRRVLAGAVGVAGLAGWTGCLSAGGGSDDARDEDSEDDEPVRPAYRFDDGEWQALDPLVTETDHPKFYHGGDSADPSNDRATHGYFASNTVSMFVHRNAAAGEGRRDGFVLTYDGRDNSDGQSTLAFDEPIDPDEDLLVTDGPQGKGQNPDEYNPREFYHQWVDGYTDGFVVATEPFSEPTFEFRETDGLDALRVLSADSGGSGGLDDGTTTATTGVAGGVSVDEASVDSSVQFRF